MSRPDAERALKIYKDFGRQTDQVVQYLSLARQYEQHTRLEVPKIKHAPTTLTSSLEEYLNDPDFEINRRQYLAQQQAKKSGKPASSSKPTSTSFDTTSKGDTSFIPPPGKPPAQQAKGPAPDLIDFFESIEQNQEPMAQPNAPLQVFSNMPQTQQYSQSNFAPLQTGYNPFLQQASHPQPQQLQTDFSGAVFGGYPQPQQQPQSHQYAFQSQLQPIPQNGIADFQHQAQIPSIPQNGMADFQHQAQIQSQQLQLQQTSTNPFRQSVIQTGVISVNSPSPLNRQSTNPFAKNQNTFAQPSQLGTNSFSPTNSSPFTSLPPQPQQQDFASNPAMFSPQQAQASHFSPQPLQPQRTGTNPFARNRSPPPVTASPIVTNPTGSTNPFRQSPFMNQQTGQGWQHSHQGTLAGFDVNSVETQPVFPRPGQG
jgi:phosphatidylinositol-binding clathrin assembly protein